MKHFNQNLGLERTQRLAPMWAQAGMMPLLPSLLKRYTATRSTNSFRALLQMKYLNGLYITTPFDLNMMELLYTDLG